MAFPFGLTCVSASPTDRVDGRRAGNQAERSKDRLLGIHSRLLPTTNVVAANNIDCHGVFFIEAPPECSVTLNAPVVLLLYARARVSFVTTTSSEARA